MLSYILTRTRVEQQTQYTYLVLFHYGLMVVLGPNEYSSTRNPGSYLTFFVYKSERCPNWNTGLDLGPCIYSPWVIPSLCHVRQLVSAPQVQRNDYVTWIRQSSLTIIAEIDTNCALICQRVTDTLGTNHSCLEISCIVETRQSGHALHSGNGNTISYISHSPSRLPATV